MTLVVRDFTRWYMDHVTRGGNAFTHWSLGDAVWDSSPDETGVSSGVPREAHRRNTH